MTLFTHSKDWCPLEPGAERLVIDGAGAFTPLQLNELQFKIKYDDIVGVAVPGEGSKDDPAIGICRCNSAARTHQFYTLVPGWLAARSSAVSESEAGEVGVADPESEAEESTSESASQSDQPRKKPGPKSKKES